MKANELRINNLILTTKDSNKDYVTTKVSGAIIDYIECEIILATPIPLTEEWLLKFGFKLAGDFTNTRVLNVVKHAYDCSEIRYSPNEGLLRFSNGGIKGSTIIPYVKHVHQLQNLYFALTGEELTLNQES